MVRSCYLFSFSVDAVTARGSLREFQELAKECDQLRNSSKPLSCQSVTGHGGCETAWPLFCNLGLLRSFLLQESPWVWPRCCQTHITLSCFFFLCPCLYSRSASDMGDFSAQAFSYLLYLS